jgi:hypothetical protein
VTEATGTPPPEFGPSKHRQIADQAAHRVLPAIEAIRVARAADVSLNRIAADLTAQGVSTPRGGSMDCDRGTPSARPRLISTIATQQGPSGLFLIASYL